MGADGAVYVSFLPGFPPVPGSAKVVRVAPDGSGSDWATGLDVLTDLQAAPDGALYAVQMAEFGERGPAPASGRVFCIVDGAATEVLSGLSIPTAIAFSAETLLTRAAAMLGVEVDAVKRPATSDPDPSGAAIPRLAPRPPRRARGDPPRAAARLALLAAVLASCAGGGTPPPPGDGPVFAIDSPADGSRVAGTVFFSAQPFAPGEVASVAFAAGGADLGTDATPEDGFRVFLRAADFPAGELVLTAVAAGPDGARAERRATVEIVPAPPSEATVGDDGAALGAPEASGALSALVIPPGAPRGASVAFAARTREQVKAATGVDYDALGVTFLGAQEITASAPLDTPLAVTSGGFGPMVQPGQAVVNYTIIPDADGDGVGELVVVNTATVTPGGDVISDPVPTIQLGEGGAAGGSGALRSLQSGDLHGPPGTFVEIEASGFNLFSALGNVAHFASRVDGTEVVLPLVVGNPYGAAGETPAPTVGFYIPVLPAGAATVVLENVATSDAVGPFDLVVTAAPPLAEAPAAVLDAFLTDLIAALAADPAAAGSVDQFEEARRLLAEVAAAATPEEEAALRDLAGFVDVADLDDLLTGTELRAPGRREAAQCSPGNIGLGYGKLWLGTVTTGAGLVGSQFAVVSPPLGFAAGALYGGGTLLAYRGLGQLGAALLDCVDPPPDVLPPLTPSPKYCSPPPRPVQPPTVPSPEGLRAQQADPSATVTGMGSATPPGGDTCGSALGGGGGSSARGRLGAQQLAPLLGDLAGRFVVRVFYGAGRAVPFAGVSDPSGFFYVPLVPAGQPFEAIAFDTLTGETRSFEGVGPEIGRSAYISFDFLSEGDGGGGGATVLAYDGNAAGVYDGVDLYLFEGRAGDLVNLAVFSEEPNLGGIGFELSDPNGLRLLTGLASGGRYFETGLVELATDGLYAFSVDGGAVSGAYTLGLAEIAPPAPLGADGAAEGELVALGDRQFVAFGGAAGERIELTLAHDAGSSLNAELRLLEPLPGRPFHDGAVRLRLRTSDAQRSRAGSVTLAVDGEYVLELTLADPFDDELARHLGNWRATVSDAP